MTLRLNCVSQQEYDDRFWHTTRLWSQTRDHGRGDKTCAFSVESMYSWLTDGVRPHFATVNPEDQGSPKSRPSCGFFFEI